MASQVGGLIQDQNLNVLYNGAPVKSHKKGGLGGRKPLSDLSNSVKPVLNQALKSKVSQDFSASKVASDVNKKKIIPKMAEKGQTSTRKALSDLSNSVKPILNKASTGKVPQDFAAGGGKKANIPKTFEKEQTGSRKPLCDISNSRNLHQAKKKNQEKFIVTKKPINLGESDIEEEGFLHNHEECIKAQTKGMEMNQILQILGLDNGFSKLSSPPSPTLSTTSKSESPLSYHMKLDEVVVHPFEEDLYPWNHQLSSKLDYSPPQATSQLANHLWDWDWSEPNFRLIKSP